MNARNLIFILSTLLHFIPLPATADPIKVGVSVTLSGEAATFGTDMRNAIQLAQEDLGKDRYQLIVEDDRCLGKDAADVAHKFITIDKVAYAIGFGCNQVLLASAPIYQKAGVTVISGFGTSGDVTGLGDRIFRLFPADQHVVEAVYPYISERQSELGVITEENEYPELVRRTLLRLNSANPKPLKLVEESFKSDLTDLRPVLLKFKAKKLPALFLNPNAEPSFIRLIQQLEQIHYSPALYTVYWPGASVVQSTLGAKLNGIVFGNLPDDAKLLTKDGIGLLKRFRARFGEPNSVPNGVAFAYETLRLLDKALKSGQPVHEYLRTAKIDDGMIGSYSFDGDGAIVGLKPDLQQFRDGSIHSLMQ